MAAAQQSNLELHKQARLLNAQLLLQQRIETHARTVARHRLAARCILNEARRSWKKPGRPHLSRKMAVRVIRQTSIGPFREALIEEVREQKLLLPWPRLRLRGAA